MRRPQSMTFASVTRFVAPCPGRILAFRWSRTCPPPLGTGPRDALDGSDLTLGYRAEDGVAQIQGQGDTQERVEG